MRKVTIGGDRLGSGKKMKAEIKGYERSTHNLSRVVRTTMSAGPVIPVYVKVMLPGDTWDIDLSLFMNTHPTIGPLFGSYKAQIDAFQAPIRNYIAKLHNNTLGIGRNMSAIKLPVMTLEAPVPDNPIIDLDNSQINPSCILAYLGIRGVGRVTGVLPVERQFNALSLISYWDCIKNYYTNKQEEIGAVIHTEIEANEEVVGQVGVLPASGGTAAPIDQAPSEGVTSATQNDTFEITYPAAIPRPIPSQIMVTDEDGIIKSLDEWGGNWIYDDVAKIATGRFKYEQWGDRVFRNWRYILPSEMNNTGIQVATFPLENLDTMREYILSTVFSPSAVNIGDPDLEPYKWVIGKQGTKYYKMNSQEGLAVKTYQNDLLNNWLNTEWIDGIDGVSAVTAIDTSGGSFTIDTLNLAKKVYNMLNRIDMAGGTYKDYIETVWDIDSFYQFETPMYLGGLIQELEFQEVISNSESGGQPLGTLAGKGTLTQNKKGGHVTVKVIEPSYLLILLSLTPRIDYSQGNEWDTGLLTADDFHKPEMDEIGFQDTPTEWFAWWDTFWNGTTWIQKSAGKQPAWINYMTDINKTFGNFAVRDNEMFMTLNRRYEPTEDYTEIADLTTYIDPAKYNQIFAQTSLDSQNFWAQVGIKAIVRRKMSAKLMPML